MTRWLVLCGVVAGAAVSAGQGPALDSVMHDKLGHAQKLLEAVVTSDWVGLESHSRELERLTEDPALDGVEVPRVRTAQRRVRPLRPRPPHGGDSTPSPSPSLDPAIQISMTLNG